MTEFKLFFAEPGQSIDYFAEEVVNHCNEIMEDCYMCFNDRYIKVYQSDTKYSVCDRYFNYSI